MGKNQITFSQTDLALINNIEKHLHTDITLNAHTMTLNLLAIPTHIIHVFATAPKAIITNLLYRKKSPYLLMFTLQTAQWSLSKSITFKHQFTFNLNFQTYHYFNQFSTEHGLEIGRYHLIVSPHSTPSTFFRFSEHSSCLSSITLTILIIPLYLLN